MLDCYNRCLCSTCTENDTCERGCDMCQQLQACRFIIARGKCPEYSPDAKALTAMLLANASKQIQKQEVLNNANTNRRS